MIPETNLFIDRDVSCLLTLDALSEWRTGQNPINVFQRIYSCLPQLAVNMEDSHAAAERMHIKRHESRQRLRHL